MAKTCAVCGGETPWTEVPGNRDDWSDLRRCPECGIIFNRAPRGLLHDRAAEGTGDPGTWPRRLLAGVRYHTIIRRLEERVPGRGRILELGCGAGDLALLLTRRGWQVWGVDPSDNSVAPCRSFLGDRFVHGGLEDLDAPDASFDAVVMNFSLEHCDDPRAELARIERLLRPGGVVLLRVPNIDALFRGQRGAGFQLRLSVHRCFFGPRSLAGLLGTCGFEVREMETPLMLVACTSLAFGWAPALDSERWIHRPLAPGSIARALPLAALALLACPFVWWRCRRREGLILQAVAGKPAGEES